MAEKKKIKPRAARDVKPSDMRQTVLEGRRKVGPARDVKPGSAREKALKSGKKAPSGGLTTSRRMSDIKKSRGPFGTLAVRKDNLPAVKKEPGKSVVKSEAKPRNLARYEAQKGGVSKIEGPKDSGGGIGGKIARGLYRGIGGPAIMLVSMTEPAGAGSDKPSGPLMKGGKLPGYKYEDEKSDRLVSPAKIYAPKRGGGPEKRQGSSSPSMASPKSEAPKKATEFKKKNLEANQKAGAPKVLVKAPVKAPAAKKPGFKGNWVGAAPTAMQARGGAKIKRKSFADLFKKD